MIRQELYAHDKNMIQCAHFELILRRSAMADIEPLVVLPRGKRPTDWITLAIVNCFNVVLIVLLLLFNMSEIAVFDTRMNPLLFPYNFLSSLLFSLA